MTSREGLRGRAAVIGIGETVYYKWGQSPDAEFQLALTAVFAACSDAGIDPKRIDGFASFSDDRSTATRLATAIGIPELRHASMVWGGGGGGSCGAVLNAAMAVVSGAAECVVVLRSLAQGEFGRLGQLNSGQGHRGVSGELAHTIPYGLFSPAQKFAMRYQRWMHDNGGVGMAAQKAISLASYQHAQANPRAVMRGRELTSEKYDSSRWIVEPWRLFDCCQENDGAAALIVVSSELARELKGDSAAYILGGAQGADHRFAAPVHNAPHYPSSNCRTVSKRLWEMCGLSAKDVDVVESYENFTGGVVMTLVELGFCAPEEVDDFMTLENLTAPGGALPLNTSGGNLAECYMHGLELVLEAVRQLRGESTSQVPNAQVALVTGGPMVAPSSAIVLGSDDVL